MKQPDEERALTEAYRKASAEEAGRPSAATRNAILAGAAAAARRQTPASNDSRYLWRGVAGVAVVGFALLMWQQVDHRMPGDAPVVAQAPVEPESMEEAASPMVPAAPADAPSVTSQRMAAADIAANTPAPMREEEKPALQAAAPAPAAAPAAAAESRSSKMSAAADAEIDADALLRLNFPRQYQSSSPHRLWLVQDGSGNMLRSGELSAEQDFGELRADIERDLGDRPLRPWRIRSLRNARGQVIELGVATTP